MDGQISYSMYTYNRLLLGNKKEWIETQNNMDVSQNDFKWKWTDENNIKCCSNKKQINGYLLEVEGRKKEEKTEDERFEGDGWVHCHDCGNSVNVYTGQNV